MEQAARILVTVIGLYSLLGLLFAVPFLWKGVGRIDSAASHSSLGFRLLILPGTVAFWPLLARRWLRHQPPPQEHNAHRDRAHSARRGP